MKIADVIKETQIIFINNNLLLKIIILLIYINFKLIAIKLNRNGEHLKLIIDICKNNNRIKIIKTTKKFKKNKST
jgi:hypothetical protein